MNGKHVGKQRTHAGARAPGNSTTRHTTHAGEKSRGKHSGEQSTQAHAEDVANGHGIPRQNACLSAKARALFMTKEYVLLTT